MFTIGVVDMYETNQVVDEYNGGVGVAEALKIPVKRLADREGPREVPIVNM
jgi:hypothetical protein